MHPRRVHGNSLKQSLQQVYRTIIRQTASPLANSNALDHQTQPSLAFLCVVVGMTGVTCMCILLHSVVPLSQELSELEGSSEGAGGPQSQHS